MREVRNIRLLGAAAVVAVALALVPWLEPVLQNGDAAVYNEQVETGAIGLRTTHIGYVAAGIAFRAVLPGETDFVMNVMTWVFGVLGLLATYFTAHRLTGSTLGALLAAAGLLSVPAYLRGMLLSEVDVPLAALVALAFALWVHARPALAGACFGAAMLVSPLAALTLPSFLVTCAVANDATSEASRVRLALRSIAWFAAASLALYAPVVLLNWQDYVHGGRGVLHVAEDRFDLPLQVRSSARFTTKQLVPLLPLYAWGLVVALRARMHSLVLAVLLAAVTSLVLGGLAADVPVQLPTMTLASLWIAYALHGTARWQRGVLAAAAVALIAMNGRVARDRALHDIRSRSDEKRLYVAMSDASPYPPTFVNLKGFQEATRLERVVFGKTKTARALTRRTFKARCAQLAAAAEPRAYWFVDKPHKVCRALAKRYAWSTKQVGDRSFRVLLPR